jgi:outer membrane protein OmpA-like peptidoglycan-associated protein
MEFSPETQRQLLVSVRSVGQAVVARPETAPPHLHQGEHMRATRLTVIAIAAALLPAAAGAQQANGTRVLASVDGRWEHMFCDLTALSRSAPGELMVRFRYRNAAREQVTFPLLANLVANTRALDTDNRTVYGALKDTDGNVLGSSTRWNTGSGHLMPGSTQSHWVRLQAPPDSVTKVTVLLPSCLPMESVAIGGKPAVTPTTAPKPALVSQETEAPGLVVEMVELRRAPGAVVNAVVRYRNTGPQEFTFPHMNEQVRKFYLIDSKNRQKHTVVQDADRRPISGTSTNLDSPSGETIAPRRALNLWAKLSAPAEDVTTASLMVYGAPPFDNATIEGGASGAGAGDAVAGSAIGLDAALKDLGARVSDAEIRIDLAADVLFGFDEAALEPDATPQLEKLAAVIAAYPSAQVTIEGHTDSRGADDYNQALSERRAGSVKAWLTANTKVDAAKITARGLGETQPIAHNTKPDGSDNPEGRAKNRRVGIVIRK